MMRDLAWALPLAIVALLVTQAVVRTHREVAGWLGRDPFARRRALRAGCYVGAVLCVAMAWRVADRMPPELTTSAQDVVVVIDVSRSMAVDDTPPTRLARAGRLAERVLDVAPGARVGLVLFAGESFAALPLTLDRAAPLPFLEALDTDLISRRGSDLARALSRAGSLFDPESERSRQILLLSDGEHAGASLEQALARLTEEGVRVVAVGLGRAEGAQVPGDDGRPLSDAAGRDVRSARRDDVLEQVALTTGGRYWREWDERPDPAALAAALREGASLARSDRPAWLLLWIGLAALLLGAESLLALAPAPRARWRRARTRRAGARRRPGPGSRGVVAPLVLVAALLAAASYEPELLAKGDELLAAGEPQAALWLYRRARIEDEPSTELDLRMGNAHYQLDELEQAAAYYMRVLRSTPAPDPDQRFVAHFNLGNALAGLERYGEARDAFFGALLERPGDRATQFNYEWALERAPEESGGEGGEDSESDEQADGGEGRESRQAQQGMDPSEVERWLGALQDQIGDSLRDQIERQLESAGTPAPPPGGQAW